MVELHACEEDCSWTYGELYCNIGTAISYLHKGFVIQILIFLSGGLLYGIMKLYGVYGVNNLNT